MSEVETNHIKRSFDEKVAAAAPGGHVYNPIDDGTDELELDDGSSASVSASVVNLDQHVLAPSADADRFEDYELLGEEEIAQPPALPAIEDVQKYTQKVLRTIAAINAKNEELSKKAGTDNDSINPRIVEGNAKMLCELFEAGLKLLSETHPRYFSQNYSVDAPIDALKKQVTTYEIIHSSSASAERELKAVFAEDPVKLKLTFFSALKFHIGPNAEYISSNFRLFYEALELAYWELVADATGGTRGLQAPEGTSGGASSEAKTPAAAKPAPKPEKVRKVLNYGRTETPAKSTDSPDAAKVAPHIPEPEPLSAKEITAAGKADFEKSLFEGEFKSHKAFKERIRMVRGKLHSSYGLFSKAFTDRIKQNQISKDSPPEDFVDTNIKAVAELVKSWAEYMMLEVIDNKFTPVFNLADSKAKLNELKDRHKIYSGLEETTRELAVILRLVDCSPHLSTESNRRLLNMAPTVAEIRSIETTEEIRQAAAKAEYQRLFREEQLIRAKEIIGKYSDSRIRNARDDIEQQKIAMKIAKDDMEKTGWTPALLSNNNANQ